MLFNLCGLQTLRHSLITSHDPHTNVQFESNNKKKEKYLRCIDDYCSSQYWINLSSSNHDFKPCSKWFRYYHSLSVVKTMRKKGEKNDLCNCKRPIFNVWLRFPEFWTNCMAAEGFEAHHTHKLLKHNKHGCPGGRTFRRLPFRWNTNCLLFAKKFKINLQLLLIMEGSQ